MKFNELSDQIYCDDLWLFIYENPNIDIVWAVFSPISIPIIIKHLLNDKRIQ